MRLEETRTIVILGAMNPAIHHPVWYQAVGLLTEQEVNQALRARTVATPEIAQFGFGNVEILCLPDRWQVHCRSRETEQILQLASATFSKLDDTPVSVIGANSSVLIQTVTTDAGSRLVNAHLIGDLGLESMGTPSRTTYVVTYNDDPVTFRLTVAPSEGRPDCISVTHNAHRNAPSVAAKFDLAPLLNDLVQRAREHSEHAVSALESRFS